MGGRTDLLAQGRQAHGAADLFELAALMKFLRNAQQVEGDMFVDQRDHGLEDHLVFGIVEAGRGQFFHSLVHAARFNEQRSQDSLLEIKSLRRFVPHLKPKCIQVDVLTFPAGVPFRVRHVV